MSGYTKKSTGYFIAKTAGSLLDFSLDWSAVLAAGESISGAVWSTDTGITASLPSVDSTATVLWLDGGTLGDVYAVSCAMTTSANRAYERGFFVQIKTPQTLSL